MPGSPGRDEPLDAAETPRAMSLSGGDMQISAGPLSLKREYIVHRIDLDLREYQAAGPRTDVGDKRMNNTGYYRLATDENCQVRLALQSNSEDGAGVGHVQVVADF